jgi:hypothetical protein
MSDKKDKEKEEKENKEKDKDKEESDDSDDDEKDTKTSRMDKIRKGVASRIMNLKAGRSAVLGFMSRRECYFG